MSICRKRLHSVYSSWSAYSSPSPCERRQSLRAEAVAQAAHWPAAPSGPLRYWLREEPRRPPPPRRTPARLGTLSPRRQGHAPAQRQEHFRISPAAVRRLPGPVTNPGRLTPRPSAPTLHPPRASAVLLDTPVPPAPLPDERGQGPPTWPAPLPPVRAKCAQGSEPRASSASDTATCWTAPRDDAHALQQRGARRTGWYLAHSGRLINARFCDEEGGREERADRKEVHP